MAIIGSIAIGMIAQTDKFLGPMKTASKALGAFSADFGKFLAGPVGRIESILGNVGQTIAAAFENIDKTGDAADRIGTTTAALSELRYAAKLTGSETESLDAALLKFSANLGDAVNSDVGPAAKALASLNLDPKKLASQDITEAFIQVADAASKVGTDAQRSALLMDLFGKGGIQIANTAKAGGAAIRGFAEEFRKTGGSISETSRQQVAGMMDSLDRAKAAVAGIGTQIAVALSPFIDEAAQQFVGFAGAGEGAGVIISSAMDAVLRASANVADFLQGARNVFLATELIASKLFVAIMNGAATLARGLDGLLKALTGYTTGVGEFISNMAVEFEAASKTFQDSVWKTMGDDAWGNKFRDTADGVIAKSREMAERAAEANKKAAQSAQKFTISQEASDKAAIKSTQEWASKAKAIYEDIQTPLEKYQEKLSDISTLLKSGKLDESAANRAIDKAREDFSGERKYGGALEVGSSEARSAILKAISGRGPTQDKVEKNTGDMASTLRRIEDLQRRASVQKPAPEQAMP